MKLPANRKDLNKVLNFKTHVEMEELDEAIAKAKELVALLREANELTKCLKNMQ